MLDAIELSEVDVFEDVTKRVRLIEKNIVSVKDVRFSGGAKGDGIADDTDIIAAALQEVRFGGTLFFPPGKYRITKKLKQLFSNDAHLHLIGYGAVIDAKTLSENDNVITLGGKRVSSTTLSSDTLRSTAILELTSRTGFQKNSAILITSTALWNPTRPQYLKGEIVLVDSLLETNKVYCANPLYDNYALSNTTAHLLDLPSITVEGLEIEGNNRNTGLVLEYVRNPIVRNVNIHGCRYAGIYINYFIGGCVKDSLLYDCWDASTGTSYGISIGSGQGIKVTDNSIFGCRHAITLGGFEPAREIQVLDNICHSSPNESQVGCIDAHGNCERIVIGRNVTTSITIASINTTLIDNQIFNTTSNIPGILIFQEIDSDYYNIDGNAIQCTGAQSQGIWVSPTRPGLGIVSLRLSDNRIETKASGILIQPRNNSVVDCVISTLSLRDNEIVTKVDGIPLVLVDSGVASVGIGRLHSALNIYNSASAAAFVVVRGNPSITTSIGDTFRVLTGNGQIAQFTGVDVDLVSPRFEGMSSRSVSYNNTGKVRVLNPYYKELIFKAELLIDGPSVYQESGWSSSTLTIKNDANARIVSSYSSTGQAVVYTNVKPVDGTGNPGDIAKNSTPSVGQPKGWVRTDGGPWVSEGNL